VHKAQTPRKNWTRRDGQARFPPKQRNSVSKIEKERLCFFFAKYKLQAGEAGRTGEMTGARPQTILSFSRRRKECPLDLN